jgi:hypothetical protein
MRSIINIGILWVSIAMLFLLFGFTKLWVSKFILISSNYSVTFSTNKHLALSLSLQFSRGSLQLFLVHWRVTTQTVRLGWDIFGCNEILNIFDWNRVDVRVISSCIIINLNIKRILLVFNLSSRIEIYFFLLLLSVLSFENRIILLDFLKFSIFSKAFFCLRIN